METRWCTTFEGDTLVLGDIFFYSPGFGIDIEYLLSSKPKIFIFIEQTFLIGQPARSFCILLSSNKYTDICQWEEYILLI